MRLLQNLGYGNLELPRHKSLMSWGRFRRYVNQRSIPILMQDSSIFGCIITFILGKPTPYRIIDIKPKEEPPLSYLSILNREEKPESSLTAKFEADVWEFVFKYMRLAITIFNFYLICTWKKPYPRWMEWVFITAYLLGDSLLLKCVSMHNKDLDMYVRKKILIHSCNAMRLVFPWTTIRNSRCIEAFDELGEFYD